MQIGLVFFWTEKVECFPMIIKPWQAKNQTNSNGRQMSKKSLSKESGFKGSKSANIVPAFPSGQGKGDV